MYIIDTQKETELRYIEGPLYCVKIKPEIVSSQPIRVKSQQFHLSELRG